MGSQVAPTLNLVAILAENCGKRPMVAMMQRDTTLQQGMQQVSMVRETKSQVSRATPCWSSTEPYEPVVKPN